MNFQDKVISYRSGAEAEPYRLAKIATGVHFAYFT